MKKISRKKRKMKKRYEMGCEHKAKMLSVNSQIVCSDRTLSCMMIKKRSIFVPRVIDHEIISSAPTGLKTVLGVMGLDLIVLKDWGILSYDLSGLYSLMKI